MRVCGPCYAQNFHRRHRRSGALWPGRFKSCLVDSDRYLMTVTRYIELNPVRAHMVEHPEDYRWSSVQANLNHYLDDLVTPHFVYLSIDRDPDRRAEAYRAWLRQGVNDEELSLIRDHLQQERALGDVKFQAMLERTLGRSVAVRSRGRPSRKPSAL